LNRGCPVRKASQQSCAFPTAAGPNNAKAAPGNADAVVVSELTAGYGAQIVLRDVSFRVRRGEIFAILGGSGSGKTTLLRHLIGKQGPLSGAVEVLGTDVNQANEGTLQRLRRRFGILYQTGALFGGLTVAENVALPLQEFTDLSEDAIRAVVAFKLHLVGLDGAGPLYPAELSGGMRKRAGLARALAMDPELLFFDEPSSGLDPVLAAGLDRLILRLREILRTTMVVVTHDLDSVLAIADRAILLDANQAGIIAEGDPRELAAGDGRPEVHKFFSRCGLRSPVVTDDSRRKGPGPPKNG